MLRSSSFMQLSWKNEVLNWNRFEKVPRYSTFIGEWYQKTEVYQKANKFRVHWKSQISKRYKRNAINGDFYIVHGEWVRIFIMRKTKLKGNFQVQDTQ